jgi:hypothetical protein
VRTHIPLAVWWAVLVKWHTNCSSDFFLGRLLLQGKYMPRLWLLYWSTGVVERTYSYELLDQSPDANHSNPESDYGIVR